MMAYLLHFIDSPADSSSRGPGRTLAPQPPPCGRRVLRRGGAAEAGRLLLFLALGLPLQLGRCDSCGASDLAKCEGHFGFIKLPVSIYHPSHIAELTKILSMICFSCLQFKKCKKQKSEGKESNFTSWSYCQVV